MSHQHYEHHSDCAHGHGDNHGHHHEHKSAPSIKAAYNKHKLGLRGHWSFDKEHIQTAARYGLVIRKQGHKHERFHVFATQNDLELLQPDFIKSKPAGPNSAIMDSETLKRWLSFLEQPLHGAIAYHTRTTHPGANNDDIHERRMAAHHMVRFLTSNSLMIPHDHNGHLHECHNECHADAENDMRADEAWAQQPEFGHSPSHMATISEVEYDPARGFVFNLSPDFLKGHEFQENSAQAELRNFIINTLQEISETPLTENESELVLDACAIEAFMKRVNDFCISPANMAMLKTAKIDEQAQDAMANIEKRKTMLAQSAAFNHLKSKDTASPRDKMKALLACSTALTPVLASHTMQNLWSKYHVAALSASPLEEVEEHYTVFQETVRRLACEDEITPEHIQALLHEFYPVLMLTQDFVSAMDESLKMAEKRGGRAYKEKYAQRLSALRSQIDNFKICAQTLGLERSCLAQRFTDEDYTALLKDLRRYIGQPGGPITAFKRNAEELWSATAGSFVEFLVDAKNSLTETPLTIGAFALVAGLSIYANNFIGKEDGNELETISQGLVSFEVPEDTLAVEFYSLDDFAPPEGDAGEDVVLNVTDPQLKAVSKTEVPEAPEGLDGNYHWDIGILGPYKHYVGGQVEGFSNMALDGMRLVTHWGYDQAGLPQNFDSRFEAQGRKVIEPTADIMLGINIFQNISHAAFWVYTLLLGARYGPAGLRRVGTLFSPLADLGYGAVKTPARMLGNAWYGALRPVKGYHPETDHLVRLGEQFSVDGGLTQAPINRKDLLDCAYELDMLINHVGDKAGFGHDGYRRHMAAELKTLIASLERDQRTDNLNTLIGVELRHTERSNLLEGAQRDTGYKMAKGAQARAERKAGQTYGRIVRAEARKNYKQTLLGQGEASSALSKAGAGVALGFNHLANGFVGGFRGIQNVASSIKGKRAMAALAASGVAGSVAIDMAAPADTIVGQNMAPIVNKVSGTAGAATAATITTGTFLTYNFVEDVLAVHVGMGAIFILVGAGVGRGLYRRGIRPGTLFTAEMFRQATGQDVNDLLKQTPSKVTSYSLD